MNSDGSQDVSGSLSNGTSDNLRWEITGANTATGTFNVKPVRNGGSSGSLPSGFKQVAYNPSTGEFIYYS